MGIPEILTKAIVVLFIVIYIQGCKSPTEPKDSLPADTTSHNFSWKMFQFGDFSGTGNSSKLYDVAILDENDIWAVGEIYLKDTTGKAEPVMYNAVHWNGVKWELLQFRFYTFIGQSNTGIYPIRSIATMNEGGILVSSGSEVSWIRGQDQIKTEFVPVSIYKIWTNTSSDIFIAGYNGQIAHFDGKNWKKIESSTTMDLWDIYSNDGKTIYASGGNLEDEGVVLKGDINGFKVIAEGRRSVPRSELFNPYFNGIANTIWISPEGKIYFAGGLLYTMSNGKSSLVSSFEGNDYGLNGTSKYFGYLYSIRGNRDNDMVIVGERNTIRHFNGVSWKQLGKAYDPQCPEIWNRADMKANVIAVSGESFSNGIVMILKREK